MVSQHHPQGQFTRDRRAHPHLFKYRSLLQPSPQQHRYESEQTAGHEGNPPPAAEDSGLAECRAQADGHKSAEQNSTRKAGSKQAHRKAAPAPPRMLGYEYPAARSLAAYRDSLHDAHRQQQNGSGDSDGGVGGKEADEQRWDRHQQDAQREHALTSPVSPKCAITIPPMGRAMYPAAKIPNV